MPTNPNPSTCGKYTYYISGGIANTASTFSPHGCSLEYMGTWQPGDGSISVNPNMSQAYSIPSGATYNSVELAVLDSAGNFVATNSAFNDSAVPAVATLTESQILSGYKNTPATKWCGNDATRSQGIPYSTPTTLRLAIRAVAARLRRCPPSISAVPVAKATQVANASASVRADRPAARRQIRPSTFSRSSPAHRGPPPNRLVRCPVA